MMPGLQPLGCFNGPFPGVLPQAGMVRTVGAGEGEGACGWALTGFPRQGSLAPCPPGLA